MVDIEKRTLEYVQNNLDNISFALNDTEKIIAEILNKQSNINNWSKKNRLLMCIDIARIILQNYDISYVIRELCDIDNRISNSKDPNLKIIYSVISIFYRFLKSVYELYILDQILFLLKSNININHLNGPLKTNSFYESISFGLDYFQTSLDSSDESFIDSFFFIKELYYKNINMELAKPRCKLRYKELTMLLEPIIFNPQNNNFFLSQLYIQLKSIPSPTIKRVRKKREVDDNQLSFF